MLVLIVGITGNLGTKLLASLTARGHSVRGLSRSKSKLSHQELESLESFHTMQTWYDVRAIRAALKGVDAVICAYGPVSELILEGQLLLVRLMEEEGIKRYVAASWSLDWTHLTYGDAPFYDLLLAFRRQLEMSSSIKPFYIFVGFLAETFYSVPGHGGFAPANHGVWDPVGPRAEIYGTGEEKWQITTEKDCAEWTAEVVSDTGLDSSEGAEFSFCSMEMSFKEVARAYEAQRGREVEIEYKGSLQDLKNVALETRSALGMKNFWGWMGYYYQLCFLTHGGYLRKLDNAHYPNVKATTMEQFLRDNPTI